MKREKNSRRILMVGRFLLPLGLAALGLALAGCAARSRAFVPADPGPIATEYFSGEIIWRVTSLPSEPSVRATFEDPPAGFTRNNKGILPRGLLQLTLLTRDDTALLYEYTTDFPDPVRGKLSYGEGKPLYKIDYRAGTYREVKGDPEDEQTPAGRRGTDGIKLQETSEQRVILGHLCTATIYFGFSRDVECKVWSTRALLVNKAPLLFLEQLPGPLGIFIASVRGVPLLIEIPGSLRVEATSITEKIVDHRLFAPPGTAYRLVE